MQTFCVSFLCYHVQSLCFELCYDAQAVLLPYKPVTCRLYPYYVTRDMISDWGTHTSQGQAVNWDAARSMQLNNPEIRQSRHDWGSQGAATDFGGGGGNYGGGGTGGSW